MFTINNIGKKLLHASFWIIVLTLHTALSAQIIGYKWGSISAIISTIFQSTLFYTNMLVLFPKLFNKGKARKFILTNISLVIIVSILQTIAEVLIFKNVTFENAPHKHFTYFIFFRVFFWMLLIDFISTTFGMYATIKDKELRQKQLKEEKLSTEINLLKAQINPHFIFNALNNIYSLAYMKNENAPKSILKLSEMLRYVFYDCSKDKVPISSEIRYIHNFINFQKLKSDISQNIKFTHNIDNQAFDIAPMLFIPFIENSFKYSNIEEEQGSYINVNLMLLNKKLLFQIANNYSETSISKHGNGMGLKNIENRLKLIYPNNYKLKISKNNNEFNVTLELFRT